MPDYLEKELGVKELLVGAWTYLWKRPKITGMVFLIFLAVTIIAGVIASILGTLKGPIGYLVKAVVFSLYSAYVVPLILKAISFLVEEEGESFSVKACVEWGNRFFGRMILYSFCFLGIAFVAYLVSVIFFVIFSILGMIPLIGGILFAVGAILWLVLLWLFGMRIALSIYALLFDDMKVIESIKTAWTITGSKKKLILTVVLVSLGLSIIVNLPVLFALALNRFLGLAIFISAVLGGLTSIYLVIVLYRLYFNLKKFNPLPSEG